MEVIDRISVLISLLKEFINWYTWRFHEPGRKLILSFYAILVHLDSKTFQEIFSYH
jgi:hypothetical protein